MPVPGFDHDHELRMPVNMLDVDWVLAFGFPRVTGFRYSQNGNVQDVEAYSSDGSHVFETPNANCGKRTVKKGAWKRARRE
eukprot:9374729-Pyramimonas_sp.AAC.1